MGLPLSPSQLAQELNLNKEDAQHRAEVLRTGIVEKKPEAKLSGVVECDEVDGVAGHKGQPEAVKKRTARAAQPTEGSPWPRYAGKGKAAGVCEDSTWRRSGDQDVGESRLGA